jgi:DNA-binding MarR family transcriptional regulator
MPTDTIFETASALRGVISDLHKRLRKQVYSAGELSLTEANTLSYLYKAGSLFPSDLADINKIKKQSMSQVLKQLEERKLIRRVVLKEDKRKMAISLTGEGKRMIEKTRYERDEWLAAVIRERIGEKDARILAAAMPLLRRIADAE